MIGCLGTEGILAHHYAAVSSLSSFLESFLSGLRATLLISHHSNVNIRVLRKPVWPY